MEKEKWYGTFTSTIYNYFGINMVSGDIKVDLPKDITTVDTTAIFKYTGLYKQNTICLLEFKYSNPTLIGKCIGSEQVIKFTPTEIRDIFISGTYISENPYDTGKFSLSKID